MIWPERYAKSYFFLGVDYINYSPQAVKEKRIPGDFLKGKNLTGMEVWNYKLYLGAVKKRNF